MTHVYFFRLNQAQLLPICPKLNELLVQESLYPVPPDFVDTILLVMPVPV